MLFFMIVVEHKAKCMYKDGMKGPTDISPGQRPGNDEPQMYKDGLKGQKNVFINPNGQSQACLNDVMARVEWRIKEKSKNRRKNSRLGIFPFHHRHNPFKE